MGMCTAGAGLASEVREAISVIFVSQTS